MKNKTVISRLRAWLNAIPIQDLVERRMAALLQIILIGFIAVILLAAILNLVIAENVSWQENLTRSFSVILIIGLPLGLLRRGYFRGSALIIIAVFFALEAFAMTAASLREVADTLSFFTLAIILAGLLVGRRALALTFEDHLLRMEAVLVRAAEERRTREESLKSGAPGEARQGGRAGSESRK